MPPQRRQERARAQPREYLRPPHKSPRAVQAAKAARRQKQAPPCAAVLFLSLYIYIPISFYTVFSEIFPRRGGISAYLRDERRGTRKLHLSAQPFVQKNARRLTVKQYVHGIEKMRFITEDARHVHRRRNAGIGNGGKERVAARQLYGADVNTGGGTRAPSAGSCLSSESRAFCRPLCRASPCRKRKRDARAGHWLAGYHPRRSACVCGSSLPFRRPKEAARKRSRRRRRKMIQGRSGVPSAFCRR